MSIKLEDYRTLEALKNTYIRDLRWCEGMRNKITWNCDPLDLLEQFNREAVAKIEAQQAEIKRTIQEVRSRDEKLGNILALRCIGGLSWKDAAKQLELSNAALQRVKKRADNMIKFIYLG